MIVAQLVALPYLVFPLRTELFADTHQWHLPSTTTARAITVVLAILLLAGVAIVGSGAHVRSVDIAHNGYAVFLALVLPLASSAATYYSAYYLPQHRRPLINVDAALSTVSSNRGVSTLQATMSLKNDGATDVVFLEALYTITAYGDVPSSAAQLTRSTSGYQDPEQPFKDARSTYSGVVRIGRLVRRGGHLTQGQDFTTTVDFSVRKDVGQKLRLTVLLATLADTGQQIDKSFKRCKKPPSRSFECWTVPVPVHGWLNSKLTGEPSAQVSLVASKPDGIPQLDTEFRISGGPATTADKAESVFPFINSRIFTTSVEQSLP